MIKQEHIDKAVKILEREKEMRRRVIRDIKERDQRIKQMDYCIRLVNALWEQRNQTNLFNKKQHE